MQNSWGTGPVNMKSHCRLDDIGRQVSQGALSGLAAVVMTGLAAAGFDYVTSQPQQKEHDNSVTQTKPAALELTLPARPDPKSIKP